MKFLFYSLTFLLSAFSTLQAQTVLRLEKKPISNSGCFGYFPKDMPPFDMSYSEDSAKVFTSEMEVGGYTFSNITIQFKDAFNDSDKDDMQELLIKYLDFLQSSYGITSTAGYGKGHTLESNPNAIGVLDYWEDDEGLQYAIKGWADKNFIGINFIYGAEDYPVFNIQEMFLNGFRFPSK